MVKCDPCKGGRHDDCREKFVILDAGTDLARMLDCTCKHQPEQKHEES